MGELDALLAKARTADPSERITYRDAIAAHGDAAVVAMADWLRDPRLAAFAVRVLARIAEVPENRAAVLKTLKSADPDGMPAFVARDVTQALESLGGGKIPQLPRSRSNPRTREGQWPGDRNVSALERRFHDEMLGIFTSAGEATRKRRADGTTIRGYWASYFLRGVRNHGGPAYARQLLRAEGTSDGFQRLTDEGRLDLTVEALVLRPEFSELFSADERAVAANRLAKAGYRPPSEAQS